MYDVNKKVFTLEFEQEDGTSITLNEGSFDKVMGTIDGILKTGTVAVVKND